MKTLTDNNITICGHGSGKPSTKNMDSYCEARYQQMANGKHKGIIEVRRLKKMTDSKRKEFTSTYKTILNRNLYSQPKRQYVYNKAPDGKYYSDCSSSGMATYNKIGLETGGLLNTAGIHESSKFETIKVKIKSGHVQDPWKLEVGDCLLFVGSDPSRPKQIGHVEYVYKIPGSKCKVIAKGAIRQRKSQNGKIIATLHAGDVVRILDDCGDGWSLGSDGEVIGYIKNAIFKKVGKSSFPTGVLEKTCNMHKKSLKASKVIGQIPAGTSCKIETMGKHWTYVIAAFVDPSTKAKTKMKGWVPTKYLTYK